MQAHLIGRDLINGKGESFPADEILKDKVVSNQISAKRNMLNLFNFINSILC